MHQVINISIMLLSEYLKLDRGAFQTGAYQYIL